MESTVVVLNSGGLDSNIVIAHLKNKGYSVESLFVDYGQNQVKKERQMAKDICDSYFCKYNEATLKLPWWYDTDMLASRVEDWGAEGELNCLEWGTYIPMRNFVLLSLAYSLAESKGFLILPLHLMVHRTGLESL